MFWPPRATARLFRSSASSKWCSLGCEADFLGYRTPPLVLTAQKICCLVGRLSGINHRTDRGNLLNELWFRERSVDVAVDSRDDGLGRAGGSDYSKPTRHI